MANYEVTVFVGNIAGANTFNNIFIKLVGEDGESEREWIMGAFSFIRGKVSSYTLFCPVSIGKLFLIELDKQCLPLFPEDSWYPAKVEVKSPEGDTYNFPIYRWVTDDMVHCFREGKALRVFDDNHHLAIKYRQLELKQREKDYCWHVYAEGMPHCMKAESPSSLPCEVQFSFTKTVELAYTVYTGVIELKLKGLADRKEKWTNIDDVDQVFCCKRTHISDDNSGRKGNIFLCDYKRLDGVKANTINGKKQYLMAPLVLLHRTPDDELMPIAIQLLMPHTRYTLHINSLARKLLISETGVFTQ
ncbi:hypothetical protein FQN60_002442, partial [Etheostoma spectabile]